MHVANDAWTWIFSFEREQQPADYASQRTVTTGEELGKATESLGCPGEQCNLFLGGLGLIIVPSQDFSKYSPGWQDLPIGQRNAVGSMLP